MKKIGLLGGMSYESTIDYYKLINEKIQAKLGGLNSAEILMYSVNFEPIEELQHKGDWNRLGEILSDNVKDYLLSADFIAVCTNTMHKVVPQIARESGKRIISIVEETARELKKKRIDKVLLLGTKFTMEDGFYQKILNDYGIEAEIPDEEDRNYIHRVIYDELCKGKFTEASAKGYVCIINKSGAGAVILGCTEIPRLLKNSKIDKQVLNTTEIHVNAIVEEALS